MANFFLENVLNSEARNRDTSIIKKRRKQKKKVVQRIKGTIRSSRKERQAELLPSRSREGKSPSGEITKGPSGKTFPSYDIQNKNLNVNNFVSFYIFVLYGLETDC